jgi:hypothetical protein
VKQLPSKLKLGYASDIKRKAYHVRGLPISTPTGRPHISTGAVASRCHLRPSINAVTLSTSTITD